jgi:hypothetical protein
VAAPSRLGTAPVLIWFAVLAPVLVAEVFRSPRVDYRLVALGAVLPLAEVVTGGPGPLHTLAGAAVALTVVMLVTRGRRLVRRRLLGVPIGLFLHLVLGGTWLDRELFWWPAFGWSFGAGTLLDRPVVLLVGMEAVGLAVGVWAWRRYRLDRPENRRLLVATGHLDRQVLG